MPELATDAGVPSRPSRDDHQRNVPTANPWPALNSSAVSPLARHAAHDLLERWRIAMRPGMRVADRVTLALRLAAEFWRSFCRARLLAGSRC